MPKLKTHSGLSKRIRITKSGKIKHPHAFTSHKFACKTKKRKRGLRKAAYVGSTQIADMKRLVPYK